MPIVGPPPCRDMTRCHFALQLFAFTTPPYPKGRECRPFHCHARRPPLSSSRGLVLGVQTLGSDALARYETPGVRILATRARMTNPNLVCSGEQGGKRA